MEMNHGDDLDYDQHNEIEAAEREGREEHEGAAVILCSLLADIVEGPETEGGEVYEDS